MEIAELYKCLADGHRLRILNLLSEGPLCGCHFVEALGLDQVKVSKQLNYMKRLGVLAAQREANWMIYRLAEPVNPLLVENLRLLKRLAGETLGLAQDESKVAAIRRRITEAGDACPQAVVQGQGALCCPTEPSVL